MDIRMHNQLSIEQIWYILKSETTYLPIKKSWNDELSNIDVMKKTGSKLSSVVLLAFSLAWRKIACMHIL